MKQQIYDYIDSGLRADGFALTAQGANIAVCNLKTTDTLAQGEHNGGETDEANCLINTIVEAYRAEEAQ